MAGLPTQGCKIEVTKPPGTATVVASASGWSGPRITRNEIETTTLQSVAKEYLLGLQDPGEFSIEANFDLGDPGQKILWEELAGVAPLTIKLSLYPATEGSFTFQALVMNFETAGRPDDKVTATIALRITGGITTVFPTTLMREESVLRGPDRAVAAAK
jgi:hypothetical protein